MPKLISCIVHSTHTSCRNRRTLKSKRNYTGRDTFGSIIGNTASENDVVCSKCVLHFHKGILHTCIKLYASSTTASDVSTRYLGTKSHRYCTVCGKKTNECKLFSASPCTFFQKHNIILYEKSRSCPCHFVDKELKDSDLQKHSYRANSRYNSNIIHRANRTNYKLLEATFEI